LLISFLFCSCSKDNSNNTEPKAVIEAFLQPGQRTVVMVTKELLNGVNNELDRTIDGLLISITHNGIAYPLTQDTSGAYQTSTMLVEAGGSYSINFVYNNQTVSATTVVPAKPINFTCTPGSITIPTLGGGGPPSFPEPLDASWNNPQNAYHYLTIQSVDPSAGEIDNQNQGPAFTNTPDQGSSKEINFGQFGHYGRNALILYRIQPELAALYNATNGNSQNLSTVPTNVNNGLGIFTALNTADTVFITVY
jgi:hypothetical protein